MKSTLMSRRSRVAVAAVIALSLPSCAVDKQTGAQSFAGVKVSDDPCSKTATVAGAVIGGVVGAVLANQVNHRNDTKIAGIAAGATIGGLIGRDIDKRRCELFKISKRYNVDIAVAEVAVPQGQLPPPGNAAAPSAGAAAPRQAAQQPTPEITAGLSVTVRDSGRQFEAGSGQLNAEARAYFNEIAEQYSYAKQLQKLGANATKDDRAAVESLRSKRILMVGHTDDTGSSRGNADLSERRAMAVAKVFREQGISDSQLFYQGAGETLPVADNRTDEGRSKNRRVEIVDVTDDASFHKFLAMRRQSLEYYRQTSPIVVAAPIRTVPPPQPAPPPSVAAAAPSAPTPKPGPALTKRPPPATPEPSPTAPSTGINVAAVAGTFDFGGAPASTVVAAADFGNEITSKPGLSFISSAQAAGGPVVPSCSADRPRVANGVKSLRDQKDISITEYMPGLYNTSWMDNVNGNLVGLSNVAVYRDGGSPANRPNLFLYKGYKAGSGSKPDYTATPEVNAYRGDKAILYRVFVDGPVKCMDLLFPYDNSGEAKNSNLFYDRQSNLYVVSFKPKLAR